MPTSPKLPRRFRKGQRLEQLNGRVDDATKELANGFVKLWGRSQGEVMRYALERCRDTLPPDDRRYLEESIRRRRQDAGSKQRRASEP